MPREKKETITQELIIINEPSQAIDLYKITPAEIAERLKEYDSLKVIKGDAKSYKEVRGVLTALVHTRTEVEKRRLMLGKDYRGLIDKSISNINKASEMLSNPMTPYEERFRSELKTEDARLDAIKAEEIRLEEERVEGIRAEIHKIQEMAMPTILGTMALENLRELSSRLEDTNVRDGFHEFTDEAEKALDDSYNAVQDAIASRIKLDKEAEDRKEESARLEKIRIKQEADQVTLDEANKAIKAAQKKIDDEKDKLAAEKQADADRKAKEEFEKAATKKAEVAAIRKVLDTNREKEEKKKADEAEKARQNALRPDKEKIISFADSLIYIQSPINDLKSGEAQQIVSDARDDLDTLAEQIKEKAQEL